MRMLLHVPVGMLSILERQYYNKDVSFAFSSIIVFTIAFMLELSVYVNMKAKSKLFLMTEQSKQQ